eukprot:m.20773 g.20773  ORF g.20773 m.20773 type:complete len:445 (-) comp8200_c1_seq1:451-1785(-)
MSDKPKTQTPKATAVKVTAPASTAALATASATKSEYKPPTNLPSYEDVSRAKYRIADLIQPTPCTVSPSLSTLTGIELYFKREYMLRTGSFKERGARNSLKLLSPEQKQRGAIAASAGNHALGLAYHGQELGIPVTLVMPTVAPLTKVENCRHFGANVLIHGAHIGEAMKRAKEIAAEQELQYINGYNDAEIIAGQGTCALEILEQVPDVDAIVVPVGGAGLIAGISLAMKTLAPKVEIIGVESVTCPSFCAAVKTGQPVAVSVESTLADGLAVPKVGDISFEVAKSRVDRTLLVRERDIALAVLRLLENEKAIVEGAGATGLACILSGQLDDLKGKKVVCLLCGGNIDTPVMGRVIERGLAADGRLVRFSVTVSDRPGGIARLAKLIAEIGGSVKDMYHERAWLDSDVMSVEIKCVVETRSADHAQELKTALEQNYPLTWGRS